jgi:C4-dicarboxylate transporter DctM subunit
MAILFGSFFAALAIGVPVAFALGLSAILLLWLLDFMIPQLIVQRMFAGMDSFPLMAIPFFMLAGALMDHAGISRRLLLFSQHLVGWIVGGLAHVAVAASLFFAGISGSAVADTAAVGSTLMPVMRKRGYSPDVSAAVVAAAGVIGPIIPPSIPMVIYGVIAGVSIGDLFLGGVIPGLLMAVGLMSLVWLKARRGDLPPPDAPPRLGDLARSSVAASGALAMPVLIVGGILGGIFTATEAAVVATVYAFLLGMFVYRELRWRDLPEILFRSGLNTAMILVVVGAANLVGFVLANEQIPQHVATWFAESFTSTAAFLLVINLLLLVVGCFLDGGSALIIFTPVLMPVIQHFGIDPIFFGVVMTVNLMIGTITPPVGLSLFVVGRIADISIERVARAVLPFILVEIGVLLLVTYVPQLVLFLPESLR